MKATPTRTAPVHPFKADLQRCFRLCTLEGMVAQPIVTMSLPVNVFITALVAKAYPLPKTTIGLISALPFVGNFLQIFAVPLLLRRYSPKTISVVFATLHLLSWVALGALLPLIPKDNPTVAGQWFMVWFFVSSCLAAVAAVTWNSWVLEWVPGRLRGKFFGRRNRLLQVATLSFLLIAGWALARMNYAVLAFQTVIVLAVVLRAFSLRWQWEMPTRIRAETVAPRLPIPEQFRVLRNSKSLLAFVAFGAVWSFAANCFGPFYHIFMFEQTGLSAFNVGFLSTLAQLGAALSLPAWGQLLDRYGNKSVMTFSLILWSMYSFSWCFITPDNRHLLYVMWAWGGITGAGFVLGQFTILLRLIPLEAKNLAIGFNLAVTSLVAAIAPVTGGWILGWALERWSNALTVYHVCFVLQPVLALAGCLLLLRVHEPAASSLSSVVGAMRNVRTLSGVLGLSFLTNYIFFKAPPKDSER